MTDEQSADSTEETAPEVSEVPEAPITEEVVEEVVAEAPSAEVAETEEVTAEAPSAEATEPAEEAPVEDAGAVEEAAPEVAAEDAPVEEEAPAAAPEVAAEEAPAAAEEAPVEDAGAVEEAAPEVAAEEAPAAAEEAPVARPVFNDDPNIVHGPAAIVAKRVSDLPDSIADDFEAALDHTMLEFKEGDIIEGTVVALDNDEVLVDIGYKSEGVIPIQELAIRRASNPSEVVSVGDVIEALVLDKEDDEGRLILSKKRAQYERAWGRIAALTDSGGTVTGPVIEVVKGGLIVDIGLRGFLPASLVELRRVRDLDPYIGQTIEAKVIELDRNRNNVVLSRRAFLEEAQAEQRQAFLDDLDVTEVRTGVISSVVNFGAFVDLGGMDGLVHVSELSYQHVNHPSEVVKVGDEVTVRVLEVDRDRERISLSIKQTQEDPWEAFSRVHSIGDNVPGTVTKTVPFGAFVSVGEGVEGLVHVSEIAMHRVESPELELSLGQAVEVKVTEMDEERRRVSLSIKQALPGYRAEAAQAPSPDGPARRRVAERQEFQRESEEVVEERTFNVDSSLEAILQELKERGIGRR